MSRLPDWLVERVVLDEIPAASRARVDAVDAGELATRVAALREASAAELASYPAGPAVAEIEARVVRERARHQRQRRRRFATFVGVVGVASVLVVATSVLRREPAAPVAPDRETLEPTRAKGSARVLAFRQDDPQTPLVEDALVREGDVIQLRYKAEGTRYGVIASIDGAGEVTLHFPDDEHASTALAKEPTALRHAYALDDAPRFERFFFVTGAKPIEVGRTLQLLREFAHRADSATADLELEGGLEQWSLRLRKPEQKAPTP